MALGTAVHPAAVQDWTRIEAGPLLAGAPASQAVLTDLLRHPRAADHDDIAAGIDQRSADVGADRTGAQYRNFRHGQ